MSNSITNEQTTIFISYSSTDIEIVEIVEDTLSSYFKDRVKF